MKHRINTIVIRISLLCIFSFPLTVYAGSYDCTANKHNYTATRTEPTEDMDGEIESVCILCGNRYVQVIPATGHLWGEWVIDKEPACTEYGEQHRTCTTTDYLHREYEEIPPLGHEYKITTKEPGCTGAGIKTYTCIRCEDTYEETFGEPLGHQYREETTTPASAHREGEKTFTCERCGDAYTEPIAKIAEPVTEITEHEHQYAVREETQATCENGGKVIWACAACGDAYTETLPAAGHKWGGWIIDKRENLTEEGHRYRVCKNDSAHMEEEVIPIGITYEVTPAAVAVNSCNIILLAFTVITFASECSILRWERRERIKRAELLKKVGTRL